MMHVLYIKSENYSRARESLRSRRNRELFESARRKGMRKKSARATHASQCHVYVYILCFTLWPLYLRYCTLLSMKISQYIRTHSYVRPIYIRIVRLVRQQSAHLTFYLVVHSIRSGHNEQYKQQNLICFFSAVLSSRNIERKTNGHTQLTVETKKKRQSHRIWIKMNLKK